PVVQPFWPFSGPHVGRVQDGRQGQEAAHLNPLPLPFAYLAYTPMASGTVPFHLPLSIYKCGLVEYRKKATSDALQPINALLSHTSPPPTLPVRSAFHSLRPSCGRSAQFQSFPVSLLVPDKRKMEGQY